MNIKQACVLGVMVLSLLTTAGLATRRVQRVGQKYMVSDDRAASGASSKTVTPDDTCIGGCSLVSPDSVVWEPSYQPKKPSYAAIEALVSKEEAALHKKIIQSALILATAASKLDRLSTDELQGLHQQADDHLNDLLELEATKMVRGEFNGIVDYKQDVQEELAPFMQTAREHYVAIKQALAARGQVAYKPEVKISPESRAAAEAFMRHVQVQARTGMRKMMVDDDAPQEVEEDLEGHDPYADDEFEAE